MGKISEALEKAGYREGIEKGKEEELGDSNAGTDSKVERNLSPQTEIQEKDTSFQEDLSKPAKKISSGRKILESGTGRWDERLFKAVNLDKDMPEIFSSLRARILHPIGGKPVPKTIMVTSAIPKEGKSFITSNLGVSFAHGVDLHALLVDCDLRKPTLASLFGVDGRSGLVDYLRKRKPLAQLLFKTPIDKLTILPSGKPPLNPSELLSSARMLNLVQELSERYDDRIIIFDSPPLLAAAETRVLAKQVDGVILVVRQGKAGKGQIQKVIDVIEEDRIIGLVFNDYKVNYIESYLGGYGGYYREEDD